ncbi:hypothetical protein FB157_121104 [Streptomyces sp. BK340]|nr:hypothetical protein FB157_121104 [Streptomyces sp. BK340]
MAEPGELEDPKARAVNEKHGDDHGVNLSKPRALAKRLTLVLQIRIRWSRVPAGR